MAETCGALAARVGGGVWVVVGGGGTRENVGGTRESFGGARKVSD